MKTEKLEYPFDLSGFDGLDIREIVIRETDGVDERNAALNVKAKGETVTNVLIELINLSIVEVDGVRLPLPVSAMDGWNMATRNTIRELFDGINAARDVGPLLKARKPRATPSTSPTGPSGVKSSG